MAHSYLLAGATAGHARAHRRPRRATCPTPAIVAGAEELAAEHRRLGRSSTADAAERGHRRRRRRHRHLGVDGPGGREGRAGRQPVRAVRRRRRRSWRSRQPDADRAALPARLPRQEIAAEVIDGPQSVVWDEAENRLHAQKAAAVLACWSSRDDAPRPAPPRRPPARIVDILDPPPRCAPRPSSPSCSPRDGVEVTQATLSRDLVELGAVKVRAPAGALVYAVPGRGRRPHRRAPASDATSSSRPARPAVRGAARHRRGVGQPGRAAHPAGRGAASSPRHRPRRASATSSAPSPATTPILVITAGRRRRGGRRPAAVPGRLAVRTEPCDAPPARTDRPDRPTTQHHHRTPCTPRRIP